MKKTISIDITGLTVVFYIAGVVAGKSWRPFAWSDDLRLGIAAFWIIGIFLLCIFTIMKNDTNAKDN